MGILDKFLYVMKAIKKYIWNNFTMYKLWAIITILIIIYCDVGIFDRKLRVYNNTSHNLMFYLNRHPVDTLYLGSNICSIYANDSVSIPLPGKWEDYISSTDSVAITFVKTKNAIVTDTVHLYDNIIKRIILKKKDIDSLNWVITVQ
jgi:hypothetical protein